jgi:hypothetical protein
MFCKLKKPLITRVLRIFFMGIVLMTLAFIILPIVLFSKIKGGIVQLLCYSASWLIVGLTVSAIYFLFLVFSPQNFFPAMAEILKKRKRWKISKAIRYVRLDYLDYKKKMTCKKEGHQWEDGTHGWCQRKCGFYEPISSR